MATACSAAAPDGGYDLLRDEETLPVWLRRSNYRSIHIGKMPNGYGAADPTYVPPGWGPFPLEASSTGSCRIPVGLHGLQAERERRPGPVPARGLQTDVYADKAVDRIGNHFTAFPNRPLYMEVQFFAPHDPARPATTHRRLRDGALPTSPSTKDVKEKPGWLRAVARMGPG